MLGRVYHQHHKASLQMITFISYPVRLIPNSYASVIYG